MDTFIAHLVYKCADSGAVNDSLGTETRFEITALKPATSENAICIASCLWLWYFKSLAWSKHKET